MISAIPLNGPMVGLGLKVSIIINVYQEIKQVEDRTHIRVPSGNEYSVKTSDLEE